ncbi:UpxY family transcription antiterminator [Salinimicrobium sp. GXAS 041]|uniref:UpxY family transcription antiterminator n=1 Tax=Salinimicrobium sp. GXAS 041 TaxID=3400806 RepID=UPI003C7734FE
MWYVLFTRAKAEKRVADTLRKLNFEVYCPMTTEVRQWSDRKKRITVPLFRSYVFVKLKEKDREKVFEVPGVVRYLYWLGRPAIVRDREIEVIQQWLGGEELEEVSISHLSPGDKVIIGSGAFKDEEAIIQEVGTKRTKLILLGLGCTVNAKTREVLGNVV